MRQGALSSLWKSARLYKPLGRGSAPWPARCWLCAGFGADAEGLCAGCRRDLPVRSRQRLERAIAGVHSGYAAFRYDFPLTALVRATKFHGDLAALEVLRRLFADAMSHAAQSEGVSVLVPLPLPALRFLRRGFNQAGEMASLLAQCCGLPVRHDALRRRQLWAPPQSSLDAGARRSNALTAFEARSEVVRGQCVGVVDDVVTTGATATGAALALRRAGARRVVLLCLAATPPPRAAQAIDSQVSRLVTDSA
jgi:ComF family protein